MRRPVVAIDGPAGAGKSTVARRLAQELDLKYLDTGAMYRALAVAALDRGLALDDAQGAANLLAVLELRFREEGGLEADGEDVTARIREPRVAQAASALSAHSLVRRGMVARQQEIIRDGGYVLEGRDATTVIAPDADLKVYLTASLEERARRRTRQDNTEGREATFDHVRADIEARDHRDITRADSPLKVAEDAFLLETGGLTADEVVAAIRARLTGTT